MNGCLTHRDNQVTRLKKGRVFIKILNRLMPVKKPLLPYRLLFYSVLNRDECSPGFENGVEFRQRDTPEALVCPRRSTGPGNPDIRGGAGLFELLPPKLNSLGIGLKVGLLLLGS